MGSVVGRVPRRIKSGSCIQWYISRSNKKELKLPVIPNSSRAADHWEEHAIEVEISEVSPDTDTVQVKCHKRHRQIQRTAHHISFADVWLLHFMV